MNLEKNFISVIVPVYNVEKYLDRCIRSIVNQTYKNLEIILIDDGSPDNSPQMCDEWAEKDSRIKVIHKQNGGVSSARNAGINAASGDYIGFVDGDDYIDPDMYEVMLTEIIENEADAARCAIVRESSNGYKEEWGSNTSEIRIVNKKQLRCDIGEANGILPVHVGNKLFKKECLIGIRFNTCFKYSEDTLFNFQVSERISKMVYHDVCRYHYVNNSDSVTHQQFDEARFDEHRVMDIIFSEAEKDVLPYCVKGDIYKSFRTIKRMCVSGNYLDKFDVIRRRIISHKTDIFNGSSYSKITKFKTFFLLTMPHFYKFIIRCYGIYSDKKYQKLIGREK